MEAGSLSASIPVPGREPKLALDGCVAVRVVAFSGQCVYTTNWEAVDRPTQREHVDHGIECTADSGHPYM